MQYLDLLHTPHRKGIQELQQQKAEWLTKDKKGIVRYRNLYESVAHVKADFIDCSGDTIRIGKAEELDSNTLQTVYEVMRSFMPWRKGPFNVFGHAIDSEWRSERKWNRIVPTMPSLAGKVIADVGCNNGYYMFRMAHHRPNLVIGFEPYLQHYYAFQTLNNFAGFENLFADLLGVEHIALFENCFDIVFLMGILYHRVSPVGVLKNVKTSIRPGGYLIVESQGIPGTEPIALFPEERYAKVPGTYFVPTPSCLVNWLRRAGFDDINLFCTHPMSSEEQRRTDWMNFESYEDFINTENSNLTVEGYPAPIRIYIKALNKS